MTDLTTAATTTIAEKDDRIVRQQNQIERLLTASEGDQRVIENLKAEINRMRRDALATSKQDIVEVVQKALAHLDDPATVSVDSVDDTSFTILVENATIDSGEIINPLREWLVEGTISVPVSFVVNAPSAHIADDIAQDIFYAIGSDVERDIDFTTNDDAENITAGIVEVDGIDVTEG